MSRTFTESVVEDAALAWLESLGYAILHCPVITAGESTSEHHDLNYHDVVLETALRDALLPKPTSGELRINSIEWTAEAV